jgi:hypothetical protein
MLSTSCLALKDRGSVPGDSAADRASDVTIDSLVDGSVDDQRGIDTDVMEELEAIDVSALMCDATLPPVDVPPTDGSCVTPFTSTLDTPADCVAQTTGSKTRLFEIPRAMLGCFDSTCNPNYGLNTAGCANAISRYCQTRQCPGSPDRVSGFGPVDVRGGRIVVACVATDHYERVDYSVFDPATMCDGTTGERFGMFCRSAVHRYCQLVLNPTAASGFGPFEITESPPRGEVACVTAAALPSIPFTMSGLSYYDCGCNLADVWGDHCMMAAHRACVRMGHKTGFGTMENSGDSAIIACLD